MVVESRTSVRNRLKAEKCKHLNLLTETPSDSNLNDILLTQYDIRLSPHDILAFGKHDIISVPSYAKHISSTAGGYHTEGISPVPQGTDIIE
ncbi:MAG: hypothetical protein IJA48_00935, partial [Oscillospiraceae bacterium]|nr:hypothetical protein [Oscillospiraceae bacterium]